MSYNESAKSRKFAQISAFLLGAFMLFSCNPKVSVTLSRADDTVLSVYAYTLKADSMQLLKNWQFELVSLASSGVSIYKSLGYPALQKPFNGSADIVIFIESKSMQESEEKLNKVITLNARASLQLTSAYHTRPLGKPELFDRPAAILFATENRSGVFDKLTRDERASLLQGEENSLTDKMPLIQVLSLENVVTSSPNVFRVISFPDTDALDSALASNVYGQTVRRVEKIHWAVYFPL